MSLNRTAKALVASFISAAMSTVSGCGQASEIDAVPSNSQIVDVRTPSEFAAWHVPGAVNIPLRYIEHRLADFDPKRIIIVYCRSGNRSSIAKRILMDNGFTKVKNGGGIRDMKRLVNGSGG
jgi:rhodanese-related sulfurtransferase